MLGVDLDVALPLVRHLVERENRLDRAGRHAGAAVDAFVGVDVELGRRLEIRARPSADGCSPPGRHRRTPSPSFRCKVRNDVGQRVPPDPTRQRRQDAGRRRCPSRIEIAAPDPSAIPRPCGARSESGDRPGRGRRRPTRATFAPGVIVHRRAGAEQPLHRVGLHRRRSQPHDRSVGVRDILGLTRRRQLRRRVACRGEKIQRTVTRHFLAVDRVHRDFVRARRSRDTSPRPPPESR